ncbi:MAG TPA: PTS sugar transporter subunit IIA [Candidatus Dormibacteraeota bacterium]|nr:PTS sugar transporter subunit IIA [Candidatus Dormibacteraeota bacterium]
MNLFWAPGLVAHFDAATDPGEAIRMVGRLLVAAGAVTPEHVEAMVVREAEHPTGLPAAVPFALAHTDAPGALRAAAALGVFDQPVPFHRMDDPGQVLPVRLVAVLSLPERDRQAETLGGLIRTLADGSLAARLLELSPVRARRLLATRAA